MTQELKEKQEPQLHQVEENLQNEQDIAKLVEIVRKQTELNEHIIKALKSSTATQEQKKQMVDILSQGAQTSSFFMDVIKKKNSGLEIYESIPEKSPEIKDKNNKFKNMIASFKAKVDPSIVFRNPQKPDWYEMGHKVGITINKIENKVSGVVNKFISFFKKTADSLNVITEATQDKIYLVGAKKNVNKINKQFSKTFDVLGLNGKELLHINDLEENISDKKLKTKISSALQKLSIIKNKTDNQYSFSILNGLTPELQVEMLQDVLLPKVQAAIKESMDINYSLKNLHVDNKYMKMVVDFSLENNFNPDLVVHSLRNNPDLLSGYRGIDKLMDNKDNILANANKYEKFVKNNFSYLEELIKVGNRMEEIVKSLPIGDEQKQKFSTTLNNSVIFSQEGATISFNEIKANASTVEKGNMKKNDII